MKKPNKKVAPFTVHLSAELNLWIRAYAKQESRSLTKQTEKIFREHRDRVASE